MKSLRPQFIFGFLFTLILIITALVFQHVLELEPCPLCIFQRMVVIALAVLFFVGLIHNPMGWSRRLYSLMLVVTSIIGIAIAARHVWLQHLPEDRIPECGPGLDFWLEKLPLTEVLEKVFQGSGECAKVVWQFLGLSIPEWTLVCFVGLLIFTLKLLITNK
jgi:disulfide bond formation protein DsbB